MKEEAPISRPLFALALPSSPALAGRADDDPVPPKRTSHAATAGDYTAASKRDGVVLVNERGKLAYSFGFPAADREELGQLAIDQDRLFILHGDRLYALALQNGKLLWQLRTGWVKGKLALEDGKAIVTGGKNREVIDLETGKKLEKGR